MTAPEWFVEPVRPVHLRGDAQGRSYTPDQCAQAVVRRLAALVTPGSVWEPCVGGGAFVRAARLAWPGAHVTGCDLDPDAPGAALCDDFNLQDARDPLPRRYSVELQRELPTSFDLSITNPPFGKAVGQAVTVSIIAAARQRATVCAQVVPLDYLTQTGLEAHVQECALVAPLLPRPFPHERGMVLLVWDTRHQGPATHDPLRWRS